MDTLPAISSNSLSAINGGSLRKIIHPTKNIYYASSYISKISQHIRKPQRFRQPIWNHRSKCFGEGSTYQEDNMEYVVKATSRPYSDFGYQAYSKKILDIVKKFLVAFFMFSSPYALTAQTLSIISASLLVVEKLSDISPLFFIGVLQVAVPHLFMCIFVAGMNQLCDLEIDKINKPYLPLASGQISFTTGVIIVASSLTLSFWLGWVIGSCPLIWSLLLCCLLWTAYSINVPLLRWKRHPLLAAMCIFATWAIIFPISSFLHLQTFVFKRPPIFPRSLIFAITFMSLYSVGIALCKDIPDIEGDATFGIYSFSTRLGQKRVFRICVFLFKMAFGVVFLAGAMSPSLWIKIVTVLGHVVLASILWDHAKSIDLRSKSSVALFYMLIWKLLCAEYLLMPLIR